jgi:hypothetical protein
MASSLSSSLLEPSQTETTKTIRFADIIATDIEATLTLQDCHWMESSLDTASHDHDDAEDASSTRSEESEEENTRIQQQLLYAVSGAGFVAFLVWGGRKLLDLFKKRVEDEEDDRAGGGYWGSNPLEEHLDIQDAVKGRIKDAIKGMFATSAAPGAVNGTLNG